MAKAEFKNKKNTYQIRIAQEKKDQALIGFWTPDLDDGKNRKLGDWL